MVNSEEAENLQHIANSKKDISCNQNHVNYVNLPRHSTLHDGLQGLHSTLLTSQDLITLQGLHTLQNKERLLIEFVNNNNNISKAASNINIKLSTASLIVNRKDNNSGLLIEGLIDIAEERNGTTYYKITSKGIDVLKSIIDSHNIGLKDIYSSYSPYSPPSNLFSIREIDTTLENMGNKENKTDCNTHKNLIPMLLPCSICGAKPSDIIKVFEDSTGKPVCQICMDYQNSNHEVI